jgi:hypothetical protein
MAAIFLTSIVGYSNPHLTIRSKSGTEFNFRAKKKEKIISQKLSFSHL